MSSLVWGGCSVSTVASAPSPLTPQSEVGFRGVRTWNKVSEDCSRRTGTEGLARGRTQGSCPGAATSPQRALWAPDAGPPRTTLEAIPEASTLCLIGAHPLPEDQRLLRSVRGSSRDEVQTVALGMLLSDRTPSHPPTPHPPGLTALSGRHSLCVQDACLGAGHLYSGHATPAQLIPLWGGSPTSGSPHPLLPQPQAAPTSPLCTLTRTYTLTCTHTLTQMHIVMHTLMHTHTHAHIHTSLRTLTGSSFSSGGRGSLSSGSPQRSAGR